MLQIVNRPIEPSNLELDEVLIRVERLQLAKRRWRGVADDGLEFGFELEKPLKPDQIILETERHRYIIRQIAEPVLEVPLDLAPSAAVGIGWAVGNLHLELSAEAGRLLTPDDPAARQLFDRIGISYGATQTIFRPGHFVRGESSKIPVQDLGLSHQH